MRLLFSISKMMRLLLLVGMLTSLAFAFTTAPAADMWVYFGTYTGGKSHGIYASQMDATGKITEPKLVAAITNPSFLTVDARQQFLYAISEVAGSGGKKQGDVVAYSINATNGQLTEINQQVSGGDVLCHVQIDATGKTVLVASYGGGSVTAFPVNADGSLRSASSFIQHSGSSVNPLNQKGPHAHCVVTDPGNRYALVCDLGLDKVVVYQLDASTGKLMTNSPAFASLTPGSGPRHLAFHPNGKLAYVVSEMGCSVTVFSYDGNRGALSEIQTVSALPLGRHPDPTLSGAEIAVHPSGKFLYASTRGIDQINVFTIAEPTGKLSPIQHISSGGKTPRFFGIDPAGKFLFAANQNADNVSIFKIDTATGRLTPAGQTLQLGNPSCVVFVPGR
jgi:6-phosphogluconolactonase